MIVPRNRLLLWVAVVVLPFALLAALEPAATMLSLLAMVALAALALVDAVGARGRLAGISIQLPEIARMSKDRPAKLEVRIQNEGQLAKTVRLGLPLPPEIESAQEDAQVTLPRESQWSRFDWPCVGRRRGNYRLDSVYLEATSPFG